ncbi:DUF4124 domain-containing protein [Methyloglobulus sp.]|uniref:DUF4124 domain-containing protein n=1 Tax=Methyloglobulus sp. TaxID=2518622 RepID=UPI0018072DDF|nr:DUF4124 domain-containing protein [Methyloglobulus sp.]
MKFTLLILGTLFSMQLSAGVYKCTDASGKKIYRSVPCVEGQKKVELNVKTGGSTDLNQQESQQALSQQEQEAKDAQKKQEEEQAQQKLAQLKQSVLDESAKNQFLVKNNPQKYSAFAIPPYKYDDLSPLVKIYQSKLPEIERMRRQAAEKALATEQCGRVESVELSEKSAKDGLIILVDCSSAKKFYVSEQELATKSQ